MPNNSASFLRQFIRHPIRMGAMVPSSQSLADMMVGWADLADARAVVECGTGTGALTETIVASLGEECRFFGIDVDPKLVAIARARLPHVTIHHNSVAQLQSLCRQEGMYPLDCVISGLPWAAFTVEAQRGLLEELTTVLRPGGQFVTFAYLPSLLLPAGRRFARLLPEYFSDVTRSPTVWRNFPPAFVYQCRR